VRKPVSAATPAIETLLDYLESVGFSGAPRTMGRDELGRQILEYIPGVTADSQDLLAVDGLRRLGALIRDFHDAVEGFTPPPAARWNVAVAPDRSELVCHNDLAPWNLVRDGERWVFIDWDGAGPASRLWDLGCAAQAFVPLQARGDPERDAPRLRALADGYGLDEHQRRDLPALAAAHARGMYDLLHDASSTGQQPWARLYSEGHGDHWGPAADYIREYQCVWTAALLE
jgi:hypothetical protein